MAETNKLIVEYLDKIYDLPLEKLVPNPNNPREKFVESEEDELIESILSKGILNPIIVYKRKDDGKYVLLDGERRYRACLKLNIKTIPAHVLVREPTTLENISMMFHIHNVREEWTNFAIAISLKKVVEEMGRNIHKLNTSDIRELKKVTSLSEYKLRKYLKFYDYHDDVIKLF
ncbi:MAG TPA: ParB/RepB/Spo0J family partition protein, partial [Candidatus Nanoarchaeia archaeon]|nr:ParB/RepB/Spo0J family partition protein [Candidatus Nanoarchaeia archaeon]